MTNAKHDEVEEKDEIAHKVVAAAMHAHFVEMGRKGGKSESAAKKASRLKNLEKALAARWKKKYEGRIAKRRARTPMPEPKGAAE